MAGIAFSSGATVEHTVFVERPVTHTFPPRCPLRDLINRHFPERKYNHGSTVNLLDAAEALQLIVLRRRDELLALSKQQVETTELAANDDEPDLCPILAVAEAETFAALRLPTRLGKFTSFIEVAEFCLYPLTTVERLLYRPDTVWMM